MVKKNNKRPSSTTGTELLKKDYSTDNQYPDIVDLSSRIRFAPDEGRIWLDERRMFLMHNRAFGELRREIIDQFGKKAARKVLTRMGYASGTSDAELAAKVRSNQAAYDAFSVGPQMHALLGIVKVECLEFELDYEKGKFYSEYLWHDSIEDDSNIQHFGVGADAACWMQIGYACGYSSAFLGRPILFREVECRSTGSKNCRIIGKPVDDWSDPEDDLQYLHSRYDLTTTDTKPKRGKFPIIGTQQKSVEASNEGDDEIEKKRWDMVGASPGFRIACHMLDKVSGTDATVIFLGESGVGKEVFANNLHRLGKRKNKPFIAVNCAAIPEELVESELFGVEKGAFTGAGSSREGRFERANGGTLFLDEVGTLSKAAQGKLLRALQEGEIERVGDSRVRKVDVRIIAATNVDLKQAIKDGDFREDLFFRLNVFPIHIPPLRERRADIPLLLNHFLKRYNKRYDKAVSGFSERALYALFTYEWPGNIREMENMVERGVILADPDTALDIAHLFTSGEKIPTSLFSLGQSGGLDKVHMGVQANQDQTDPETAIQSLLNSDINFDEIEGRLLKTALNEAGGNLSAAARKIGLTRPQLAYRLEKLNLIEK